LGHIESSFSIKFRDMESAFRNLESSSNSTMTTLDGMKDMMSTMDDRWTTARGKDDLEKWGGKGNEVEEDKKVPHKSSSKVSANMRNDTELDPDLKADDSDLEVLEFNWFLLSFFGGQYRESLGRLQRGHFKPCNVASRPSGTVNKGGS
jgi:hypothetical protein